MTTEPLLPTNWSIAKVRDLCVDLQYGYTAAATAEKTGPRFLRITDIQDGRVQWPTVPYCSIEPREVKKYALREGDIVFARTGGTVGKSFIISNVPETSVFASYLIKLTPHVCIVPKYLYYFFQSLSYWEQIGIKKGGLQGNVNATTLGSIELPLCSTEGQHRVVAKIEELFSELDKGIQSLEEARVRLELHRLIVLHQAVCDEKGAFYPARPLNELIGPIGQGWSPKCDHNRPPKDGEWAVIKTTAVQPMMHVPHECKPLPDDLEPRSGIEVHDGDILMTRKGPRPRTGVVCFVKKARPRSMLCDTVYRFRAAEALVTPEYLELALNSPSVVQEIDARKSGINESGISLNHGRVRSLLIPIPHDIGLQSRIVQNVKERISIIEHLESLIDEQIQRTVLIRQSILRKAFAGRLVGQNPGAEPASALLERIAAASGDNLDNRRHNNKNGKREAA